MSNTYQTSGQTILQHGESVSDHLMDLIHLLQTDQPLTLEEKSATRNWVIPEWLWNNRTKFLDNIPNKETLRLYAKFHDCGKPYCKIVDENGKQHFPDHAQKSYNMWRAFGGNETVGQLILHDMDVHTIRGEQKIKVFAKNPLAPALLLSALAEIHSNALMFGGRTSDSFKIKWKRIDKIGKVICKEVFEK